MYSAFRVDGKFICVGKYHTGSTDSGKSSTVFHNTCTNSCRCIITSAAYNDGTFFQSCQSSCFCGDSTCYFRTFIYFCKHCRINVQFFQYFLRPAAIRHIQQTHTGSIRYFCRKYITKLITDIVFRQQNVACFCINFRFVFSYPKDFTSSKTCQCRVGCDFDVAFFAAHQSMDFFTFHSSSLVTPKDGGTKHFALFIQQHQRMHLTGQTNATNFSCVNAALCKNSADAVYNSFPPICRILFCPAVFGLCHRIFPCIGGNPMTCFVKKHRFGTGSTNVDTKQIIHCKASL